MAHPLSPLGIAHTLISLLPVVAGLHALVRHGWIDPIRRSGRLYLVGLVLSVVTSFGLSSRGGVNAGHVLGVLALVAAFGGMLAVPRWARLGRLRTPLAMFGGSLSFFLLLVPGISETLTRVPVGHPLATGPDDPLVRGALLAWLGVFVAGSTWQVLAQRASRRAVDRRSSAGRPG